MMGWSMLLVCNNTCPLPALAPGASRYLSHELKGAFVGAGKSG